MAQRGGTCYMTAATLLVARGFMRKIKHTAVREYLLLAQAQDWDRAYGPQTDVGCPRVPSLIRQEYAKLVRHFTKGSNDILSLITHDFLQDKPYVLEPLTRGGLGGCFASALMWTSFGNNHAHKFTPGTLPPDEGDTVIVINPLDPMRGKKGVVVKIDYDTDAALIMIDNKIKRVSAESFSSLGIVGRGTYPIQFPPGCKQLPAGVSTLLHETGFLYPLSMLELSRALKTVTLYGRQRGYNVVGMILSVVSGGVSDGHAVAGFPCPTFADGWMFCNTWRGTAGGCVTFAELQQELEDEMGGKHRIGIQRISILYECRKK